MKDIIYNVIPSKIENHNADGLCSEQFCSNKPTMYFKVVMNGVQLIILLCETHADLIERLGMIEKLKEDQVQRLIMMNKDPEYKQYMPKD